jgi:Regulator of chromosome condensation (RCC1) repeat
MVWCVAFSNGNSGRLGLGPENLKAQRTPQHVSYLSEKGIYVWSVACGAAHTAITTRVELQEGDAAIEGLTNLTGGQVMVTGAGWALGREQLNRFAFVKEFKNVSGACRVVCSVTATQHLPLTIAVSLSTATREASFVWLRAYRGSDVRRGSLDVGFE